MGVVRVSSGNGKFTFFLDDSSEQWDTFPDMALVDSVASELRDAIGFMCEAAEDWNERPADEQALVLRELAATGERLLEAISGNKPTSVIIQKLSNIDILIPDASSMVPWEFLYLGDADGSIDVTHFLGASTLVARWYESITSARKQGRPSFGRTLEIDSIFGVPDDQYEILLAQDLRLSSAKNDRERRILENGTMSVLELPVLRHSQTESFELFKEILESSEVLSHFNCHAEAPRGGMPDKEGKVFVTDTFPVTHSDALRLSLTPNAIVVLNVCYGADLSEHRNWCMAPAFAKSEGSAVVAAYSRVPDGFASVWADAFYEHLFKGLTVWESMVEAKKRILSERNNPAVLLYTLTGNLNLKLPPMVPGEVAA